jgi:hypothetical protein
MFGAAQNREVYQRGEGSAAADLITTEGKTTPANLANVIFSSIF